MSSFTSDHGHNSSDQPPAGGDASRRKQQRTQQKQKQQSKQSQQPRQLLSCTTCRARKVKCDRTKPCIACCARGAPKECHFVAMDGDYAPIQQSYELKRLRAENLRLKERLRAGKVSVDDEDSDHANSSESIGERGNALQNRRISKQKRFQGSEWQDSLYFGNPGGPSVVKDFATINITSGSAASSLAYSMPRASDLYTQRSPPTYPFPTMFPANPVHGIPALLSCLPPKSELLQNLSFFEKRVNICSFPFVPAEISKSEVERFLADQRQNAQMCPDMLALLFAALALGGQHSVWDKSGGQWNVDIVNAEMRRGEVYIAAAMQALRLASYTSKPSLLGIQALIMIGPWLTNSGRFLDAWALFGITIRLAQSIGLHRHPKYLDPPPPTQKECSVRQAIWWWLLRMDEQYSMTLGRPLGISGIGDCLWPHELTTDPTMVRFSEFVNHFTIQARQILSSDRLTHPKIDEYTDALRALLETMPETLQFDESWTRLDTDVPEWPLSAMAAMYYCKTQMYLILLNRQRIDKHSLQPQANGTRNPTASFRATNRTSSAPSNAKSPLRGRPLVISASENILCAFIFFFRREPAALMDWTIGQQAFNSCMILLLDAIEHRVVTRGVELAEMVYGMFKELEENDVHKLAGLAFEKVGTALHELHRVSQLPPESMSEVQTNMLTENEGLQDTVMGNTGLLLLEDLGLQAFAPETWAPISWSLPDVHADQVQAMDSFKTEPRGDEVNNYHMPDRTHDARRSTAIPSASSRYPTPSEDEASLRFTDATSNADLVLSQHSFMAHTMRDHGERRASEEFQLVNPPQLLPGSLCQPVQAMETTDDSEWDFVPSSSGRPSLLDEATLNVPALHHQVSSMQLRHNSCSSIPDSVFDPALRRPLHSGTQRTNDGSGPTPILRGTPLRASVPAAVGSGEASFHAYLDAFPPSDSHVEGSGIASGTSQPPTSMFNMTDPVATRYLSTSSGSRGSMAAPKQPQGLLSGQTQQMGYGLSSPRSDAAMSTMASFADAVSLEEWQRRMGMGGGV